MFKKIFLYLVRVIVRIIARVDVYGLEKVPPGGVVCAANHLGRIDPVIMFVAIKREDTILPVAEKYRDHWLFGPLGRALGGTFIDRNNPDFSAVREVLKRLKGGGLLGIAPEGTRSKTEALQRGKPGTAFFAIKAGVPVIPVALIGTEDRVIFGNLKRLRRSHIIARAGDPFVLTLDKSKEHEEALQDATDEIMCRIAAMLPEKNRGMYAEHPRLKELVAQESS